MKSSRRHESLIPLSREHHYGLMLCLRIHRRLPLHRDDGAWLRAKAAQTVEFFSMDLTAHFKAEEDALFPAMRGFSGASILLNELISEHRELERLAEQLGGAEVAQLAEALVRFADLLEAHIRKEERDLFPLYEEQAANDLAAKVGRAIRDYVGDAIQPRDPELLK
ncbi:MAG TPA: hemerythrin domain-containing protein [Blastocatellia bacterium]|nr:hemerythrin domain-containing protein [Blastocatellia bacterium]